MIRKETETCCAERTALIRTDEHYKMCLTALERGEKKPFGIVFSTNLNLLTSFSFTACLVADIMHDLLSGILVLGTLELIKKAIKTKKLTLIAFNNAKNTFDYGQK